METPPKHAPAHVTRLLFRVASSRPGHPPFEVDLSENGGNGSCTCEDFRGRCGPHFHENGGNMVNYDPRLNETRTRCKHINQCALYLGQQIIDRIRSE